MEKGKLKEEKKQLSIVLIPHSPNKTKVLQFTTLYAKLPLVITLVCITLTCVISFITYTVYENVRLRISVSTLAKDNQEKNQKLVESEQKSAKQNELIKKFEDKYKEITDSITSGRGSTAVLSGRSGSRTGGTILSNVDELKDILDNLYETTDSEDVKDEDLKDAEKKLAQYKDSLPSRWPTSGSISSKFGSRSDPFGSGSKKHAGIDISAPSGQSIMAAGDGTVIFSGWYSGYGYSVIISHGHGLVSVYGHASKLLVKQGKSVKKGDAIARVGSSGRSTGPHLHYEVRLYGTPVDPLRFLEK